MRILMLAHRLPYPPRTGDKVRAYHVARHLARRHELTLACLADEPDAERALVALRQEVPEVTCVRIVARAQRVRALCSLALGGCATMAYFASRDLGRHVAARLRSAAVDALYVSSSSMAQYVPAATPAPVIMDFVDIDSDKWRQYGAQVGAPRGWVYRLESQRLRDQEAAAARRAARCLVATSLEQALLHAFAPWAPTSVIPNGVDLDYFRPAPTAATEPTIVFTGAMDYFPNVDAVTYFCQWILPRIRREVPDARFVIVGKRPVGAVRRLAGLRGVEVTGTVPDVRPFLGHAAVAVAPLRVARGVQNKVLEAMAMGLPVVTTGKAHQGLDARPGEHLFVEDDPVAFAEMVATLLRSPALRAAAGAAARKFVEAHHSWDGSMAKLDEIIAEVVGRPRVPALDEGAGATRLLGPGRMSGVRQ